MKRTLTVLSALAVLQALLFTFGTTPATASVSQGYVGGAGVITDDWGDEGPLSQTSHATSGATVLWQWVLYADGAMKPNGAAFGAFDIDGQFGSNTAAATRNWQSRHGVGVDGIVGPQTFGAADGRLELFNDLGVDGLQIGYRGSAHVIEFFRKNGVYWSFQPYGAMGSPMIGASYGVPPCIVNGTCF